MEAGDDGFTDAVTAVLAACVSYRQRRRVRTLARWSIVLPQLEQENEENATDGPNMKRSLQVILEYYDDDDSKASRFRGWLQLVVSSLTFIFVPIVSGVSDTVGRRTIISWAFIFHAAAAFALAGTPNSLLSVVVCDVVAGLANVIVPVSQSIMIDVVRELGEAKDGDASHGLGLAFAAFGLAMAVGDVVGGSLTEDHRSVACLICGGIILWALASLHLYGWEETAPVRRKKSTGEHECSGSVKEHSGLQVYNPLSVLEVFLESRVLLQISLCYFLFVVALNVFAAGYNYVHYRFDWSSFQISLFFAAYNTTNALSSSWGIRRLVPDRLSEENGALFGTFIQACAGSLYALCFLDWMLYPVLVFASLQKVVEPCLCAIMARFVTPDRQGGLQGAVMGLRVLAEGTGAVMFLQIFSAGSSISFPEMAFYVASVISLISLAVAWSPLRTLSKAQSLSGATVAEFENGGEEAWTSAQQRLLGTQDVDSDDGQDVIGGVRAASTEKLLNALVTDEPQTILAMKGHGGVVTLDGSQHEVTQSTSNSTPPPWS